MRILILTFYYPPDLSAGSFRAAAFVEALQERVGASDTIDVITTLPNRYRTFSRQAPAVERCGPVEIHRIALPPHRSGRLDQSRAYLRFAWSVLRLTKRRHYDLVFATSSRLLTAALGALCSSRLQAPLYLDIRDVFPETIRDLLRKRGGRIAGWLFGWLERYAVHRADGVNLVSPGFLDHYRCRYPGRRFSTIPNGVDELFQRKPSGERAPHPDAPIRVLYSGNVGEAQGLHEVLPGLASRCGAAYEFVVLGDGGARLKLERALEEERVGNVTILPPIARYRLPALYAEADILFMNLNDWPALKHVIPSKVFEYAASGKPILAGVGGVAHNFLRNELPDANVAVFEPCNAAAAFEALNRLSRTSIDRADFVARFSRTELMTKLAGEVLSIASPKVS